MRIKLTSVYVNDHDKALIRRYWALPKRPISGIAHSAG
jgi:hypothetical protein